MFLGIDEFTVLDIEQIFIKYMDRTVVDVITGEILGTITNIPAGSGQVFVRGSGGQFIGKIHR